jgi:hypothetical protein
MVPSTVSVYMSPAVALRATGRPDNVRRIVMKLVILFIMILASVAASGQGPVEEDVGRSQVLAATKDAVRNLLDEVSRAPLTRRLTVGDFLRETRSTDEMNKVLQRAQQMGGPRWIDDHTCQIELQISGPLVAQQLKRAAAADPRRSPIALPDLDRAVRNWEERAFTATGSATSRTPAVGLGGRFAPPRAGFLRDGNPRENIARDPWRDVNTAGRESAVATAKAEAARRSLASIEPIPLTAGTTVGDVLGVRSVGDGMHEWLISRGTVRVDLNPGGEATVELAASPAQAFDAFRRLAVKQKDVAVPTDEREWDRVRGDFERMMLTPVGRSVANAGGRAAPAPPPPPRGKGEDIGNQAIGRRPGGAVLVPDRAPAWVDRRLSETGRGAPDRSSKLRAALAAESAAEQKLRREIELLPLTDKRTIGQAMKDEPRVERAVTRALRDVRRSSVRYNDDGSAEADVYFNLETLWQELRDLE